MATEEIIITTDKAVTNIDDLTTAIDKNTGATEEHGESLLDNAKNISIMGISFNSVSAGIKGFTTTLKASVTGLKIFKIALAATGIGLIVVALGAMVTFLTKTQEGMDIMNKVMNRVKFTIEALIQRVAKFGKGLIQLISGNLKGLKTMSEAFTGIGQQIADNIEMADAFSESQRLAEIATGNLLIQVAAYNNIIAEGREILNDTLKTENERLEAGERALQASDDLARVQAFNIRRRIADLKREEKAGITITEDINKRKALEAELINLETQNSRTRLRIATQLNVLRTKAAKERLELAENFAARSVEIAEDLVKKEIDIRRDTNKITLDMTRRKVDTELEIEESKNNGIVDLARSTFNAIGGALKEGSIAQKLAAIADVILNGVIAVIKMWAMLGPLAPFSIPLIGAAVGIAINKIKSIAVPPPPRFAVGGFVDGPSHDFGGVTINAEGGEGMINAKSMAMPGVRAAASYLNTRGGYGISFQDGGQVPRSISQDILRQADVQFVPVLAIDSLHEVENQAAITEIRAEL